jgi:type II secretory pathway pseudopilin PulG
MSKMQRKNGFSLVEVVISLAVIIIVSASALTIVLHSIADSVTAVRRTQAQHFSYNVWECFKAADSADEFVRLVKFAEGIVLTEPEQDGDMESQSEQNATDATTVYAYTSEEHQFTAQITVGFTENGSEFQITVNDKNEKELVAFSYTKGGGI